MTAGKKAVGFLNAMSGGKVKKGKGERRIGGRGRDVFISSSGGKAGGGGVKQKTKGLERGGPGMGAKHDNCGFLSHFWARMKEPVN